MDATDDAEQFLLKTVQGANGLPIDVDYSLPYEQAGKATQLVVIELETIAEPEAATSKKHRVTSLDSPLTSDKDSMPNPEPHPKLKESAFVLSGTKKSKKAD